MSDTVSVAVPSVRPKLYVNPNAPEWVKNIQRAAYFAGDWLEAGAGIADVFIGILEGVRDGCMGASKRFARRNGGKE